MGAPGFVFEGLSAGGRGRLNWGSCGWEEDRDIKDATTSKTQRAFLTGKKGFSCRRSLLATVIERRSKELKTSVKGSSNVMFPNDPSLAGSASKVPSFPPTSSEASGE